MIQRCALPYVHNLKKINKSSAFVYARFRGKTILVFSARYRLISEMSNAAWIFWAAFTYAVVSKNNIIGHIKTIHFTKSLRATAIKKKQRI